MTKLHIVLLLFLVNAFPGYAQSFRWAKRAGAGTTDNAQYIKAGKNGAFYVAGFFTGSIDFDSSATRKTITGAGGTDIYLAKFNCARNPLWINTIGGTQNEGGTLNYLVVEPDITGRYIYLSGSFRGAATFGSTNGITQNKSSNSGSSDGFLAKYDTSGVLVWVVTCGGPGEDNACGLDVSQTGFVYLTGSFAGTAGFNSRTGPTGNTISNGGDDMFIAKYTDAGGFVWASNAGGASSDLANKINVGNDNSVYVTGNITCCGGGVANFGTHTLNNNSLWGGYIAKSDTNGNWLWVNGMGTNANEGVSDCITDNQDNVYMVGHFDGNTFFSSSAPGTLVNLPTTGLFDLVVAKLDKNGVLKWAKGMGGPGNDYGWIIKLNAAGNPVIGGEFSNSGMFSGISLTSAGMRDACIVELSASTGNGLSAIRAGGPDNDRATGLDIDEADNIYTCGDFGQTALFGATSLTSAGSSDSYFGKIAPFTPFSVTARPDAYLNCGNDSALLCSGNMAPEGKTFLWLKNNTPMPGETNDTLITKTPGTYRLIVTNACLERDTSQPVTVITSLVLQVSAGADTSVCISDSIQLHATGADTYRWKRLAGITDTTSADPYVSPLVSTHYIVTGERGACSGKDTVLVSIRSGLLVFAGADTAICRNDSVQLHATGADTYRWERFPGIVDTVTADPYVSPLVSTHYIVTGERGTCSGKDTVLVSVGSIPVAFAGADTVICPNDSVQLHATGADSYRWDLLPGIIDTAVANPKVSPQVNTFYIVTGSRQGCVAKDTVLVSVRSGPVIFAGADTTICAGDSVTINASAPAICRLKWAPVATLNCDSIINPQATPSDSTTYYLTATDTLSRCTSIDTVIVAVNKPKAGFTATPLLGAKPLPVVFTNNSFPASGLQYLWDFGDAGAVNHQKDPSHVFESAGTFSTILKVVDAYGCSDTFSLGIEVRNNLKIFIPNVFTPNGDGCNEDFSLTYDSLLVKEITGTIWNRWGGLIYSFQMPSGNWWNGKFEGVDCADGVYYYLINITDISGTVRRFSGTITLLR